MQRNNMNQPFRDSSLSRSNIYKSLPELPSLIHCNDDIEMNRENIIYEPNMNASEWQPLDNRENAFEGDSSTSFWHENTSNGSQNDNFNHCRHNVICTAFQLQSRLNASQLYSGYFNNGQTKRTFVTSSTSSPLPHWSVSGFSMKQSEEKRFDAKDLSDEENRKLTRQYFVTVFSICYAIFLVVFGAIVFIGDVFESQYPLPQVFCIYMLVMALGYFLYLYIDIRTHICRAKNELKDRIERNKLIAEHIKSLNNDETLNMKLVTMNEDAYTLAVRELNLPSLQAIPHRYCFIFEQNGASFYVKLGASWFAFGLLIYAALQLSYDVIFIKSNGANLHDCASYITLALNILFPLYSSVTLFFIVKYMNVVINVNRNLARIFLMHAIGTSLILWVFTIIRETADAIAESDAEKPAVGIWCKIYENINHCPRKSVNSTTNTTNEQPVPNNELSTKLDDQNQALYHDVAVDSSSHIQADCHASFNGIFFGLLMLIMSIVSIILMFTGLQNESFLGLSVVINNAFECSILFILFVSTTIAYTQTVKLEVNPNAVGVLELDDILLLITIPAFFINSIFSSVPAFKHKSILRICIKILQIIDVLVQTPFIIDGRRRCLNSNYRRENKTDRQLIMFLAIANMSMWIYKTFAGRTAYASDEGYAYYGYHLWNILNHICSPLMMFYRFHSSVCLFEIWNQAYARAKKHN